MRSLDRPVEDGVDATNHETRTQRLGLSSTVASQIERYQGLARRDARVPFEEGRKIAALIPGARVVMLPGSRHRSELDAPEAFNEAVLGFLESPRDP